MTATLTVRNTDNVPARESHQALELEDCSFNLYIWERRQAAVRAELEAPGAAA